MPPSGDGNELGFLPWHVPVWEQLSASLAAGRFPHALLLEGQSGTGRNAFAVALARVLLCDLSEPNAAVLCASCKSCELTAAGTNPDFLSVFPEEIGKSLGIDQIRRAIDFANKTSALGQGKAIVISPAESMTRGASNALLKSLEEPSAGTVLILVTKPGAFIPATIRSRCQRWVLPAPTSKATTTWLESELPDLETEALEEWMRLCPARPMDIKRLVESDSGDHWLALNGALAAVTHHPSEDATAAANSIALLGANLSVEEYLDLLESQLHELIRGKETEDEPISEWNYGQRRAAFQVLDELRQLRLAQAAGSNPQADLLKLNLARQLVALGER